MSKHTLSREIAKELERLNDRIDRNIIAGKPYRKEAARHHELMLTMERMRQEDAAEAPMRIKRRPQRGKSRVRRTLSGGAFMRLFSFGFA